MSSSPTRARLGRHSEYTYKFNATAGRHGWLRLTPAYSLKIVEELMAQQGGTRRVLDPFCGTGTTTLCASYHGHTCTTIDINPFLVWLARVKTECYTSQQIEAARDASLQALHLVAKRVIAPAPVPSLSNIERWWDAESIEFLCLLRAAIDQVATPKSAVHNLLLVAFCRTLIKQSNAAFNHQSLSFKKNEKLATLFPTDPTADFEADTRFVLDGACENPTGSVSVIRADARCLQNSLSESFEVVITSPPYANRISYIRELRPYMYWLGFLENGKEAGELDWQAIGGTWGVATSRLANWERSEERFDSPQLTNLVQAIASKANKNGRLLANYVMKYFDDMWAHFGGLPHILSHGAEVYYIVGNSTFYGTLIPTEQLYAEMLSRLGFAQVKWQPLRKRNSKKELVEFVVSAKWG